MWLKNIMRNFQQVLSRKIWNQQKRVEVYMIIRGKIINVIQLNDIGKRVEFGKELSLNEYEVNKSKDLQNAIKRDWVEIVFDRGMIKRSVTVPGQQVKNTDSEIIDIAKKMAQTMIEELPKDNTLVKEIAKELAKEMILELKENLKIEQVVRTEKAENKKIDLSSSDNVFVEFKDEDTGMKSNIKELGTVKVQKDNLSSSLEKMKKIRQQQK
jgi:hypothetical protein